MGMASVTHKTLLCDHPSAPYAYSHHFQTFPSCSPFYPLTSPRSPRPQEAPPTKATKAQRKPKKPTKLLTKPQKMEGAPCAAATGGPPPPGAWSSINQPLSPLHIPQQQLPPSPRRQQPTPSEVTKGCLVEDHRGLRPPNGGYCDCNPPRPLVLRRRGNATNPTGLFRWTCRYWLTKHISVCVLGTSSTAGHVGRGGLNCG